jgi:hypothetical protein
MSSIQSDGNERQVVLGKVSDEDAEEIHKSALPMDVKDAKVEFDYDNVVTEDGEMVIHFKDKFYSFNAEHSVVEGDIVIHCYVPDQAKPYLKGDNNPAEQKWMSYWLKTFPQVLDPLAREYFDAEYPRLQVKYTEEVASWWFKGQGYGSLIDPKKFVHDFLVKLDVALQASS